MTSPDENLAPAAMGERRCKPGQRNFHRVVETMTDRGLAVVAGEKSERSQVMTLRQTADYLRVSKAHLSNIFHGKVPGVPPLPHATVGRRILIKRIWADEWLEEMGARSVKEW